MAPSKPKAKAVSDKARARIRARQRASAAKPRELLSTATAALEDGDLEAAARLAQAAYQTIGPTGRHAGAALTLLGQVQLELGKPDQARLHFRSAVEADPYGAQPEDEGGGAEKFLWLAQLSEEGGRDSVAWYERGAAALRVILQRLADGMTTTTKNDESITDIRHRLAETLCAVAEVYMTDLSWEAEAEARCESLVTEATMLAPDLAETWQTVASVRISQMRTQDARAALERSLALWQHLGPADAAVPAFAARVSLTRLLIETGMEDRAVQVADRLVGEDDGSVEAWYLAGFARYRLGEKRRQGSEGKGEGEGGSDLKPAWTAAHAWLSQCLRLFEADGYEDERLAEHARELVASIERELGDVPEHDDDSWDGWEDMNEAVEGDDETMQ